MEQMETMMYTILSSPATGDNTKALVVIAVAAAIALLAVLSLMGKRRK